MYCWIPFLLTANDIFDSFVVPCTRSGAYGTGHCCFICDRHFLLQQIRVQVKLKKMSQTCSDQHAGIDQKEAKRCQHA